MPSLLERIWYQQAPGWTVLLEPLLALASGCYALGLRRDQAIKQANQKALPLPLISVGNITVGGTGKTPVTRWLAECCLELGQNPCILTRGYGSTGAHPRKVIPGTAAWHEFGDEPVLLAQALPGVPVYAGRERYAAGELALRNEHNLNLFILDDGFQHLQLNRDVDVVLVDGERGFGNGHLLPWGPLREPVSALDRASTVVQVFRSKDLTPPAPLSHTERGELTLKIGVTGWRLLGEQETHPIETVPITRPAYLLSGIASPGGFEHSVQSAGLNQAGHAAFPDHYPFSRSDVERVQTQASQLGARVVTTAKDGIRLEDHFSVWTKEEIPIIIEVGLKHGDGTEYLTSILKGMFARGSVS